MTASGTQRFWQLHQQQDCFIMPNAWDAGSAVLLAEAGFEAIATTSAGIAYGRALADGMLDFDTALAATAAIVDAVDVGVSMDSENGYAEDLETLRRNFEAIAARGVAGASIEDYRGDPRQPYYDLETAVERVRVAAAALAQNRQPPLLTARCECFLYGHDDAFGETVERLNRYREAGAACLYAPGIRDLGVIRELVRAVDAPLNVVMGLAGTPVTLAELRDAGVRRVSIGGALARAALGLVRAAAREMRTQGSFGFAAGQIADQELCRLFAARA